jgi:hypothetical protein
MSLQDNPNLFSKRTGNLGQKIKRGIIGPAFQTADIGFLRANPGRHFGLIIQRMTFSILSFLTSLSYNITLSKKIFSSNKKSNQTHMPHSLSWFAITSLQSKSLFNFLLTSAFELTDE